MPRFLLSRPIFAWAMYDFANSAFATSVLSVIFSVYFTNVLVPKEGLMFAGMLIPGESLWGYVIALVMGLVILFSPVLGHRADVRGLKRFYLLLFIFLGCGATLLLIAAVPGRLFYTIGIVCLALFGYEMSLVFYNAFLNDLAEESHRGRISGLGFSLGYVGGGLCLALNMWMIQSPAFFGLSTEDSTWPIRVCMFVVGMWWFLFSIPTFLWLGTGSPQNTVAFSEKALENLHPFRQFRQTLLDVKQHPDLTRFLISYLIFDDGVQTILLMAAIFGAKVLGMSTSQLALCYLMIQFVAFLGALIWGRLADMWDHKKVILTTLIIFCAVTLWATWMRNAAEFWMLGIIVGFVMGGIQSASRSMFSLMIPPHKSGEYFSLFSIIGKAASLGGPFVFGLVSQLYGIRMGVGSLLLFFIIGGAILLTVDEKKGAGRRDFIS